MSHITSDTIALAELYHHAPENLMLYSIKFIGAVVVLGRINAPLLLGVLALLPPLAALALILGKRMYRAQSTSLHRIGEINARVEESLGGMRVVQSYANEAEEARKFGVINEQFLDGRKSVYRSEAHFSLAVDQFANLALAAIAVFGGLSILGGTLALPDLIPFILYIGYLLEPVQHLAWTIEQYQMGIAGYHRFMDVLETQPEIHDEEGAAPLPQASGEIRFENVGFRYRDDHERVLRNLSFHVRPGETVAIVGHSGVGKTTLCALIPRFYEPQEGRITIDGKDVRSVTLGSLRRQIGMVEQDCYLFSGTVYDNILYGRPDASEEEVIQAARRADAHEFILEWPEGYQTDIGPRGVRLSGGQRQRISVARAFLKDPPILILDEATSALDNESESHLRRSLEELSKNRTTLVIAHRLSTVRRAGRILVLTSSGIAEEGTHDDLIARDGVYARLYEAGA